jgi:hypothetical protein
MGSILTPLTDPCGTPMARARAFLGQAPVEGPALVSAVLVLGAGAWPGACWVPRRSACSIRISTMANAPMWWKL